MSARLAIISLALFAGACTLINESRLGERDEGLECETELADCTLPGGGAGECRGGACVPVDDPCIGDECEEPLGPGKTSFSNVPGETSGPTVQFRFSSTESTADFECRLDGGLFAPCASPWLISDLADGVHTIEVRAIGRDGTRESPALVFEWTVDSTVLDTFLTASPPSTTGKTVSFEFGGTLAAGFECRLSPSESSFTPCNSPKEYSNLPQRSAPGYTFEVRALDADDVPDASPASHTFMVDAQGPTVTIAGTPLQNETVQRWDANFTFTANEAVSTFRCAYQSGSFNNCSATYGRIGNRPGQHTLQVKAIDLYGNEGPVVTRTWNVVPRQVADIRTIRTEPIADGTVILLDEGWGDTATRITFVDHDYEERYWIQQSDGSVSPDNAGMVVYPYSGIPSDIGSSPRITAVVWRSENGETMLVDAEHEYFNSNTLYTSERGVDHQADNVRLAVNQGLLVGVGGRYYAGSGGCSGASVHLETCNGSNRILCLDLSFVTLPVAPGDQDEEYLSLEGIPIWTETGVRLLVLSWDVRGDDVCL